MSIFSIKMLINRLNSLNLLGIIWRRKILAVATKWANGSNLANLTLFSVLYPCMLKEK